MDSPSSPGFPKMWPNVPDLGSAETSVHDALLQSLHDSGLADLALQSDFMTSGELPQLRNYYGPPLTPQKYAIASPHSTPSRGSLNNVSGLSELSNAAVSMHSAHSSVPAIQKISRVSTSKDGTSAPPKRQYRKRKTAEPASATSTTSSMSSSLPPAKVAHTLPPAVVVKQEVVTSHQVHQHLQNHPPPSHHSMPIPLMAASLSSAPLHPMGSLNMTDHDDEMRRQALSHTINCDTRGQKGLRHFSRQVCDRVMYHDRTTYNQVADDLVQDYLIENKDKPNCERETKNIRRRVYDALNVLMAMKIIAKEKREIRWLGLENDEENFQMQLNQQKVELEKRIQHLQSVTEELTSQLTVTSSLAARNSSSEVECALENRIYMPFIIIHTVPSTAINCLMTPDQTQVSFDFNSPFELHNEVEILRRMTESGSVPLVTPQIVGESPMTGVEPTTPSKTQQQQPSTSADPPSTSTQSLASLMNMPQTMEMSPGKQEALLVAASMLQLAPMSPTRPVRQPTLPVTPTRAHLAPPAVAPMTPTRTSIPVQPFPNTPTRSIPSVVVLPPSPPPHSPSKPLTAENIIASR